MLAKFLKKIVDNEMELSRMSLLRNQDNFMNNLSYFENEMLQTSLKKIKKLVDNKNGLSKMVLLSDEERHLEREQIFKNLNIEKAVCVGLSNSQLRLRY